ncbi:hypothetical protein KUTeg_002867 [Tegillarca granosa]|uniref:PiggyBac transposable element-derived protein domain-containing protein n=1 Tax=Tegillarca granosa TaxID=220873 RepID=A0ABQ9FQN9_TEGGR|nr:hypothetical protein KUTeg_002867 [Tegillarca granosa]
MYSSIPSDEISYLFITTHTQAFHVVTNNFETLKLMKNGNRTYSIEMTNLRRIQETSRFFFLFLPQQLVLSICIATNQYAASLIAKGQNLSYVNPDGTWTPVTVDEMYRFIGIIIYMSFVQLPSTDKYWSTSPLYKSCNSIIPSTMTLKRFKAILSFIQINGEPDKDEKLTRIQPLIDHIQTTSQLYFHPFETISVDERMVASKHKFSGIRQFVKEKPIRFGIKLWVLVDTVTGYTYSFFVYLGKKRLSYNVVMELTKPLFNQGYRLYTDCFYTSLHLANDLLQNRTYLIGAIKAYSTAMPICLKGDVHLFNKCATRGDFRWHRESTFVFVQWKDCRTITFMSPIHKGSFVSDCMRTLEYRECLAMSLLDVNTCSKDKTLNKNCIPGILDNRKDCSFCSASSRMQGLKYLSVKTTYYCSSCKVPLCYTKDRNCFQRWHSDEDKQTRCILYREFYLNDCTFVSLLLNQLDQTTMISNTLHEYK